MNNETPALLGRPRLCVLATGGTIAGVQSGDSGYKAGALGIDALVAAVPGLDGLAELELEQVCSIGSQDMDDVHWHQLLERCRVALARPEIGGVVITHGTDTMEETAYFLNLALDTQKPVVVVGAMRPASSISADGPMNLFNAVAACSDTRAQGRGVLLVANDEIHFARAVAKTNTTQVGTFRSINRGLAGLVNNGQIHWFAPTSTRHTHGSVLMGLSVRQLPRVEIIQAHAGMDNLLIDAAVSAGARGLVIAGVGSGNMHEKARLACAEAVRRGVRVVRASRTGGGIVGRNVEMDDDALGFVAAGDLNPQKARVLLQLALLLSPERDTLQMLFDTH